jgi:general secretion pathway protein G
MYTTAQSRQGFTLVEILVVVLIITILATVVGIRVANQPGEARIAAAKAQLVVFRTALNLYRMNHGQVPAAAQGLEALCRCPTRPPVPQGYPEEGYIESRTVPKDPWGRPYVYLVPGPEGLPYDLLTYGADGEPGGTGENADLGLSAM